jgi:hypothetical protein
LCSASYLPTSPRDGSSGQHRTKFCDRSLDAAVSQSSHAETQTLHQSPNKRPQTGADFWWCDLLLLPFINKHQQLRWICRSHRPLLRSNQRFIAYRTHACDIPECHTCNLLQTFPRTGAGGHRTLQYSSDDIHS